MCLNRGAVSQRKIAREKHISIQDTKYACISGIKMLYISRYLDMNLNICKRYPIGP